MKKLLFGALATLAMVSCENNKYSVTAVFPNSDNDGKMAYIIDYDSNEKLDSAEVKNKNVHFEGVADTAYMALFGVKGQRASAVLVVEGGDITIDTAKVVSGTPLNDKLVDINSRLDSVKTEEEAIALMDEVLTENKENPLGYYAFSNLLRFKYWEFKTHADFDSTLAAIPSLKNYKAVQKRIKAFENYSKTAEGTMFTDFTVVGADSVEYKLSDYVGKGNYVLVDFWASWCPPCRAEMPNLKEIKAMHEDKGLVVLGVAVRDKVEDTEKAIEELGITWDVIKNAQREPLEIYGIVGIPHIILFAPDGTIVSRGLYGEELKEAVTAELEKK